MITERVTGMAYHAAGYDRQSQERNNRSATSPAVQRANNRAEAERRKSRGDEIVWVGHYSEKLGTSAFRADKERPEFERLLNDCRKGIVNMIIVDYVSRFSRLEIMDAIPIVTELLNLGVVIVSTSEGEFRKNSLMDLIHIIMRLDAAHNESRNKSRAVKGAHDLAKRLGGYVGKVPYGFELEPVSLPNPDNPKQVIVIQRLRHSPKKLTGQYKSLPAVMLEAAERFEKGMDGGRNVKGEGNSPYSLNGICVHFREAKVPTIGQLTGKKTADSQWDPATLKRMLRDPFYAGFDRDPIKGANGKVTGYRIKRDPVTMRPVELECGPMIPPALWWKIQPGLEQTGRGKGQSQSVEPALLSAMDRLYCECSNVMVGHRKTANPRKSSYHCKRGNKILPGQHEGTVTINMYATDEHIARSIFARIQMAEVDDETADILAEAARRWGTLNEAPEQAGERAELLAQRADAVQALEELYEDRRAGGYSGKMGRRAFLAAEAEHTMRMEGAEERLAQLDEAATPILPVETWLEHDLSADDEGYDPIGPGSWWDRASVEDRRELVALFVDRIVIRKSKVIGSAPGRPAIIGPRVEITWAQAPQVEDDEDTLAA
ncbi:MULTISPECIES: recombinase family protein [Streptomyces]|uniref:recombinase family protein n=1 Tax=Streptomyces TaxID=1883 RepID=UPI001858E36E|nr:recombinase family protein [Streptomyces murinus]MBA9050775.1 DNA invertase Pin-like site-specific DNA recombinase [Streptomyces murinus]